MKWPTVAMLGLAACASGERSQSTKHVADPGAAVSAGSGAGSAADPATPSPPPTDPVAPPPPPTRAASIEMTFAGDVMFGRFKNKGFRPIRAEKIDPFIHVDALLASDHVLLNLETPVMRDPPEHSKYGDLMRFVTSPARIATLPRHGIKMVTIANNHFWDMHRDGVEQTPVLLAEAGIRAIGAARTEDPLFRAETETIKGWKVGFIAAATECNTDCDRVFPKLPWAERDELGDKLVPVIEAARADHDLVIVSVHWGKEYLDVPEAWQVRAAHKWIDAGADAVIAHHPHVIQGIERYKDKLIAYSLGNFLFDNTTTNRKWGGVLRLRFDAAATGSCLAAASFFPTITVPTGGHRITVASGKGFKAIAERLTRLSKVKAMTRTTWTVEGDRLTTPGAACE